MRILGLLLLFAGVAHADGEKAGDFDYYVLSLSWSPTWCALEGDQRKSPQCDSGKEFGWILHGLWPQYEKGWPSYCRTSHRNPSRRETAAQADVFGTSGSAWHQWNKHGRCSGLSSKAYYTTARKAYANVIRPDLLRKLTNSIELPASVIEDAFLAENDTMDRNQITITCKAGRIQEARICLTKELELRRCGLDVSRDCTMQKALLDPIR